MKVSMSRKTASSIALASFFCAIFLTPCFAGRPTRGTAIQCVKDFYSITDIAQAESDVVPGFSNEEADNLVKRIALKAGIVKNIRVITCDGVDNANAFHSQDGDGLPPDFTDEDYIIYNTTWIRQVIGADKIQAEFVLGHELGHIANDHLTSRKTLPTLNQELEADYAGGCAVANLRGSWAPLENLISRIRLDVDSDYPSATHSLEWASRGFENCGGIKTVRPDPPVNSNADYDGIRVVYFRKDDDNGIVDRVLTQEGIQYEVGQSGNGVASNGITCTTDIPYSRVRNLAVKLVQAGSKIYWINKALTKLHAVKRITIESESLQDSDTERNWTPLTVKQIQCTDSCRGWNSDVLAGCGE